MKKIILSVAFIGAFALYVLLSNKNSVSAVPSPALQAANESGTTAVPSLAAAAGAYKDGSYTGTDADAYFGKVQVKAVIQNGRLTDVQFLDYPSDRTTSKKISDQAMPVLKSEAIQAQSATVDVVSGATQTSQGFMQSLADALSQAKS
jgi:uncharacterized protein with FMN-binding domain